MADYKTEAAKIREIIGDPSAQIHTLDIQDGELFCLNSDIPQPKAIAMTAAHVRVMEGWAALAKEKSLTTEILAVISSLASGERDICDIREIQRLREVEEAARRILAECEHDSPPTLGSIEHLKNRLGSLSPT